MGATLSARSGAWTVPQNADINVTPFVDVMPMLLIIYHLGGPARGDGSRPRPQH